ncbi:hypothetical protein L1049_019366 [Liquidambar formosana]|uniref:PDZ domain-containing protein n=1 Tax=Liquidambar formosana TaxID=63359 RepID=A0AAP0S9M1_LIQFO
MGEILVGQFGPRYPIPRFLRRGKTEGLQHLLMSHLLRKIRIYNRNSVVRIVALATIGSGFLYSNVGTDSKATVSVSVSAPLRDSLSWPRQIMQDTILLPSFVSWDHWQYRNLPLFSSRISPVPSAGADIEKEAAGEVGDDSSKCCSKCLGRDTIAVAAAMVAPAVVNISVPKGLNGLTLGKSTGSGTIINSDGTILTCAHVVVGSKGYKPTSKGKVEVTLQDGRTFEGMVVNADLHSDIAIVKIKSKTPLPMAKLGRSSKLRPGDWVVAMGCPLSLQNTITAGIGNSGGPLVNIDGEVVGVNIMKLLAADGLGFSVPIDSVCRIIDHFKKNGRVVRPWLGLKMLDLNDLIISQLKERDATFPDVQKGVLVPMVTPGSPADHAGFHPGDVVIEFGGEPVESIKEIIEIMGDNVGIPINVVVKRAKNSLVTLTVVPEEANPDM